jgi:hypothetical protein
LISLTRFGATQRSELEFGGNRSTHIAVEFSAEVRLWIFDKRGRLRLPGFVSVVRGALPISEADTEAEAEGHERRVGGRRCDDWLILDLQATIIPSCENTLAASNNLNQIIMIVFRFLMMEKEKRRTSVFD